VLKVGEQGISSRAERAKNFWPPSYLKFMWAPLPLGPLTFMNPFTCLWCLRFRVALSYLYGVFHHHMRSSHPREAFPIWRFRVVCAGSGSVYAWYKRRFYGFSRTILCCAVILGPNWWNKKFVFLQWPGAILELTSLMWWITLLWRGPKWILIA